MSCFVTTKGTTRGELATVIYGLKYYRHFLGGFPFVPRTDQAALTHLLRTPHPAVSQSAQSWIHWRSTSSLSNTDLDWQRKRDESATVQS